MVIYRSRLDPTINRNFEPFTSTDFLAAIPQRILDKAARTVRYYRWHSASGGAVAKMRWTFGGARGKSRQMNPDEKPNSPSPAEP